jgi:hypothetical protein
MSPLGSGLDDLTEQTFTPDRTRAILKHASRLAGLDATGAKLLRHQTNAVYQLADVPVVIKIARPGIRHAREVVALVQWIETQRIPTVPLLESVDQPLELAGCSVTLWEYLPQAHPISADDIAEPLRALHDAPLPPITLPVLAPIQAIHRAIGSSVILSEDEQSLLRHRCDELAKRYAELRYDSTPGLIHGDPQHRNALWNAANSRAVLCDWESAAIGQPEWDLVTIEVHCRRFGYSEQEYRDFCERYGRDIRGWDGFPVLRDVRELRMITTNARKSTAGTPQAEEVHRRVAELVEGRGHAWRIL